MVQLTRTLDVMSRFLVRVRERIEALDASPPVASCAGTVKAESTGSASRSRWGWEPWGGERADNGSD